MCTINQEAIEITYALEEGGLLETGFQHCQDRQMAVICEALRRFEKRTLDGLCDVCCGEGKRRGGDVGVEMNSERSVID